MRNTCERTRLSSLSCDLRNDKIRIRNWNWWRYVMNGCKWCDYKENEWLLYQSLHWSVYLADIQDYVGRCILVLNSSSSNNPVGPGLSWALDVAGDVPLRLGIGDLHVIGQQILGEQPARQYSCGSDLLNTPTRPGEIILGAAPGQTGEPAALPAQGISFSTSAMSMRRRRAHPCRAGRWSRWRKMHCPALRKFAG